MQSQRKRFLYTLAAAVLVPTSAYADMVWPALFVETRLLSIPIIVLGLLIETAMLRFGFQMDWRKAAIASLVVNAISTIAGIVLIPLAGVGWEIFPGLLLYKFLNMGTFNPLTWSVTFLLATAVTTAIEVVSLRRIFKLPMNRRTWVLWFLANAASVGLAFLSLLFSPADDINLYHLWLLR